MFSAKTTEHCVLLILYSLVCSRSFLIFKKVHNVTCKNTEHKEELLITSHIILTQNTFVLNIAYGVTLSGIKYLQPQSSNSIDTVPRFKSKIRDVPELDRMDARKFEFSRRNALINWS